MTHSLQWQKFPVLDQGYICLVDVMGDDSAIVQAARVSYGKDERDEDTLLQVIKNEYPEATDTSGDCDSRGSVTIWNNEEVLYEGPNKWYDKVVAYIDSQQTKDRQLIRYLMNHSHTTPFEMVEIKFMVQVPMDAWRQWVRHRTANINEYSTRYTEALDFMQQTDAAGWRLQAADNKQGSSGFLEEWPDKLKELPNDPHLLFLNGNIISSSLGLKPGEYLSDKEKQFHELATQIYQDRLTLGIAKEQARKDLPLSTYTRLYWKCDLHNIFNFLRLRMDSHAQLEIRTYANAMYEIVKQICPVACEAFEDYVLHAKKFSRMEMECIRGIMSNHEDADVIKPNNLTDREWKEFLNKLS